LARHTQWKFRFSSINCEEEEEEEEEEMGGITLWATL
jgi:hypothetical protein